MKVLKSKKLKVLSWMLIAAMFISIIPAMTAVTFAEPDLTIENIANELARVHGFLDEQDRVAIQSARTELQTLAADKENAEWDNIITPLLTDEVVSRLEDEANAKAAMIDFAVAMGDIYYSVDETELKDTLNTFKNDFKAEFQALFGNDVTVKVIYDFLIATREALPTVLDEADLINKLTQGDNETLIDTMPTVMIKAMKEVLTNNSNFADLSGKLNAIGWSAEKLVEQQGLLADVVDPDSKGELALAKVIVRSEAKVEKNGVELENFDTTNKAYKDTANVGDEITYTLKIMGKKVTSMAEYVVSEDVIEVTNDETDIELSFKKSGDGTVVFHRTGENQEDWWIAKVDLEVTRDVTEEVTLKGYASWLKVNDDSGITVVAKQEGQEVATTITDIDGLFELVLENGTYSIEISKPGYLKRTIEDVVIENELLEISAPDNKIELWAGDINGDDAINASDMAAVIAAFNTVVETPDYNELADFNKDGAINASDMAAIIANFNKTATQYSDWNW